MPGAQKGVRYAAKLTDEERLQVCQWLAAFTPAEVIQERVRQEFKKEIKRTNIYNYLHTRKWQPLIERCRAEWAAGMVEIPLSHKRSRVEELGRLYARAQANPTSSEWTKVQQSLAILREIRTEMDEAKTNFTNITLTQITHAPDTELLKRRDELLVTLKQQGGWHGLRHRQQTLEAASSPSEASDGGSAVVRDLALDAPGPGVSQDGVAREDDPGQVVDAGGV